LALPTGPRSCSFQKRRFLTISQLCYRRVNALVPQSKRQHAPTPDLHVPLGQPRPTKPPSRVLLQYSRTPSTYRSAAATSPTRLATRGDF
jgi:hypothetical protein